MSTKISQRYNTSWYDKKIKQTRDIKKFLVKIILSNKEEKLNWSRSDLLILNYEDLFEIAVAAVNKKLKIVLGKGQDWDDGVDAKVSVVRHHCKGQSYAAGVKVKNKKYVRSLVYEGIKGKFYFFMFPVTLSEHSIPFDIETGEPKRNTRKGQNSMWTYECKSFNEMALKAPDFV